jgi:hypothetical protein
MQPHHAIADEWTARKSGSIAAQSVVLLLESIARVVCHVLEVPGSKVANFLMLLFRQEPETSLHRDYGYYSHYIVS